MYRGKKTPRKKVIEEEESSYLSRIQQTFEYYKKIKIK